MAEAMLIGAGIGAGGAMLTGNDPLKGAAMGGVTGGIGSQLTSNPLTQEALKSGVTSTVNPALVTGTEAVGSTVVNNTMNPALTNGLGESSNMLTQFGRDASGYMSDIGNNISDFGNSVGDTISEGFDYMNDKTGMENKDWTQMGLNQGMNAMQPDPQQQIQAAPIGQGISRPNIDLSKSAGSLLSSNPLTSGPGGRQMTQKDYELLKQGLL
jgi:hypothetical protein